MTKKLEPIQQSSNDTVEMLVNEQKQSNEGNTKISERLSKKTVRELYIPDVSSFRVVIESMHMLKRGQSCQ